MSAEPGNLARNVSDFEEAFQNWILLTHVLKKFNRRMGLHDLYPFALAQNAFQKLWFVHDLLENTARCSRQCQFAGAHPTRLGLTTAPFRLPSLHGDSIEGEEVGSSFFLAIIQ
jgi:hypothetical protein